MNNTIEEQGHAQITITLTKGKIRVSSDGTILHEVKAKKGDWAKLWKQTMKSLH